MEQERDDTSVSDDAPAWFHSDTLDAFQRKLDRGEVSHKLSQGHDTYCCGANFRVPGDMVIFEPRPTFPV